MVFLVMYIFFIILLLLVALHYLQTDHYADYGKQQVLIYRVDIPKNEFVIYDRDSILSFISDIYPLEIPRIKYTTNDDKNVVCCVRDIRKKSLIGLNEKIVTVLPVEKILIFISSQTSLTFQKALQNKVIYVYENDEPYIAFWKSVYPTNNISVIKDSNINSILEQGGIILIYDYVHKIKNKLADLTIPITIYDYVDDRKVPFAKITSYDMSLLTKMYMTKFPVQSCLSFDIFMTIKKEKEHLYSKEQEAMITTFDSLYKINFYTQYFGGDSSFSSTTLGILHRFNKHNLIRDQLPILEQFAY